MDSSVARLRRSELFIHLDRGIRIEINSFTDPITSSMEINNDIVIALMSKYNLSKNDVLSVYRTATILNKLKEEVNLKAGTYLQREQAKIVIDRFNKVWEKSKISVGSTSIRLTDL